MALTRIRRIVIVVCTIVGCALIGAYLAWVGWLFVFASEGDVPPVSTISLPAGSELVSETSECASGGCWSLFEVRPMDGSSPDQVAAALGATPQACVSGSILDPRTIRLHADPKGPLLFIRADYWSSGC